MEYYYYLTTILEVDCGSNSNNYPEKIKDDLFYNSLFIDVLKLQMSSFLLLFWDLFQINCFTVWTVDKGDKTCLENMNLLKKLL